VDVFLLCVAAEAREKASGGEPVDEMLPCVVGGNTRNGWRLGMGWARLKREFDAWQRMKMAPRSCGTRSPLPPLHPKLASQTVVGTESVLLAH
jgi:hypothetical protein